MIAAAGFKIEKISESKLENVSLENLTFGRLFTDYMLEADYANGEWTSVVIKPYQPLSLDPSTAALHYGQAIFEGIKAYKNIDNQVFIFRPMDNFRRFNISAERMCMPAVPEEIFVEGMRQLIDLERGWVPNKKDHSLYLRPFMFSTDAMIGVRASENYKFMIICSPTGPYYNKPMRIYVEEQYTRAAPGGIGYAKAAANYGAAMLPTAEARSKGFDQVLWTDAFEHKWVQEIGTMNVFFVINNTVVTPDLTSGTILEGVTRDCALTILGEMGLEVQERPISIDELVDAHKNGILKEVFGTGTAATISPIAELTYRENTMMFDVENWKISTELKQRLDAIREGSTNDVHNWMFRV